MAKIIFIECASCHAKLKMAYSDGLEDKKMICPQCKSKMPISDCQYEIKDTGPVTQLADSWHPTRSIGTLTYTNGDTTELLTLAEGMNVIGRAAKSSDATIQVQDDERLLSRKHFAVDVVKKEGYYEHRLSILTTTGNTLCLNGKELNPIDIIVLNYGDVLSCKGRIFRFSDEQE